MATIDFKTIPGEMVTDLQDRGPAYTEIPGAASISDNETSIFSIKSYCLISNDCVCAWSVQA